MKSEIEHVSDTALMVAACRAIETGRADGMVRDPFAERLAGERGMAIARSVPFLELMSFGVATRDHFMDDLVMETVQSRHIETVVNLGAGLDTRPWRLDLPPSLRWIEADFEGILEYKSSRLASETPRCHVEQLPADLSSPEDLARLFERAAPGPALMITEGLLMYLSATTFRAIAQEAPKLSGIQHWLLDAASMDSLRRLTGGDSNAIERLRPADYLQGQALLDAARESGWEIVIARPYTRGFAGMSPARIAKIRDAVRQSGNAEPPRDEVSGVYLLKRAVA